MFVELINFKEDNKMLNAQCFFNINTGGLGVAVAGFTPEWVKIWLTVYIPVGQNELAYFGTQRRADGGWSRYTGTIWGWGEDEVGGEEVGER